MSSKAGSVGSLRAATRSHYVATQRSWTWVSTVTDAFLFKSVRFSPEIVQFAPETDWQGSLPDPTPQSFTVYFAERLQCNSVKDEKALPAVTVIPFLYPYILHANPRMCIFVFQR